MAAVDRIRGRCMFPETFSVEDKQMFVRVLHYTLDGLRDIGALHPIKRELADSPEQALALVIKELGVSSSIVYMTPNQRQLTRKNNPLRQQLLELQQHDGEEGRRAKGYLKEIGRLSRIISQSISVMQLGLIRGVNVEKSLNDGEVFNCQILYQVPLPNLLNRSAFYQEATDLVEKDVRKYLGEKGVSLDVVRFQEVPLNTWKLSDVEERYRPIARQAASLWGIGKKAA